MADLFPHHILRGLLRLIVAALLGPRVRDEMDVMRPVHQRVHAGRPGALDERLVRGCGPPGKPPRSPYGQHVPAMHDRERYEQTSHVFASKNG